MPGIVRHSFRGRAAKLFFVLILPFCPALSKTLQTVWKRLSLSGDKSRKLVSAMFEHSGAGCRL
jgi:hypothetical protein